ncbi:PEGA domain-containing protein [Jatrophihabitans endophyticus]|uniref:PEGA domain-containing protein n=1 Tax=Jatrophihabitans endophyticus TaxID=1206085 RepID=A0A1M5DTM7_9ACTN|nr:PEGA domain-containing protein [Jatrophihabitans endophyticus]SHF70244.1 PEGA domain-containing protein [Jatrophihabitans endophyticus]
MGVVRVSCDRWLGLGAKYVASVDGREVGRLGRRVETVSASVDVGSHRVTVEYAGNRTAPVDVNVTAGTEVRLELVFASRRPRQARAQLHPGTRAEL